MRRLFPGGEVSVRRSAKPSFWPSRILAHRVYNEYWWAFLFLLPALVLFALFTLYPVLFTFLLSFEQAHNFFQPSKFVGLRNYEQLFSERLWRIALLNTIIFTFATVPVRIAVALLLALLIQPLNLKLQGVFRGVFYLPAVSSAVILALVWLWIYYPTKQGLANHIIEQVGISPQIWLGNQSLALPAIIFMVWATGEGAMVVLYGAALNNIPTTLYDAADIDCATPWSKFAKITWPLIKPTTLYGVIIGTIGSFQVFDIVFTMTGGGPGYSTRTLVYQIYSLAFLHHEFGYAAAQAVVLAFVIAILSVGLFRWLATDVEY